MKAFFLNIYNFFYYEIAWEIAQFWGYRFGKHKENVIVNGKEGFLFENRLNGTIWFHPYDNSFYCSTPNCSNAYLKKTFFGQRNLPEFFVQIAY